MMREKCQTILLVNLSCIDIFTLQLWNDKHSREDVVPALKEALERLKMDYVDLYLIHFPIGEKVIIDIVVFTVSSKNV